MRGRVRRSHWRWALIAPTKSISVMFSDRQRSPSAPSRTHPQRLNYPTFFSAADGSASAILPCVTSNGSLRRSCPSPWRRHVPASAGERRWSHSDECLSGIRVSRKGDLLIAHGPCITISPHKAG
jgi:hypothetical protein